MHQFQAGPARELRMRAEGAHRASGALIWRGVRVVLGQHFGSVTPLYKLMADGWAGAWPAHRINSLLEVDHHAGWGEGQFQAGRGRVGVDLDALFVAHV